jgi:hypothetical protein
MSVKPGRPNIGRNFRIISLRTCIIRFVPCSLFRYIILVVGGWDPKILPHSMGTPLCGCGANRRWAANHEMRRPNGGLAEFGRQPVMLNSVELGRRDAALLVNSPSRTALCLVLTLSTRHSSAKPLRLLRVCVLVTMISAYIEYVWGA